MGLQSHLEERGLHSWHVGNLVAAPVFTPEKKSGPPLDTAGSKQRSGLEDCTYDCAGDPILQHLHHQWVGLLWSSRAQRQASTRVADDEASPAKEVWKAQTEARSALKQVPRRSPHVSIHTPPQFGVAMRHGEFGGPLNPEGPAYHTILRSVAIKCY